MKQSGLTFATMLEELPIVVKNSHLMNVMLAELTLMRAPKSGSVTLHSQPHLELGTRQALQKSMRAQTSDIDELNKALAIYNKYALEKQKYDNVVNSLIQKRVAENEARKARGESPLPLDEIRKLLKQPQLQLKNGSLDLFLSSSDTNALADYSTTVTGECVAKLFLSEAVSGACADKERVSR